MIDPQAKPKSYFRLMLLVAILGVISAVITFVFMALVHEGTNLIWEQTAQLVGISMPLFTILVCTLGGLLVGLLVKLFGDHSGIFAEVMREFGKTGRFDYRNAPGIVITAFFSLISGASLGPEAPLADACGGIGTWASDRLKLDEQETRTMGYSGVSGMLAAFITNPFGGALLGLESAQGGTSGKQTYFWVLFPSLLASAVSTVVFVLLSGVFFETLYVFPDYAPKVNHIFYAVPLGHGRWGGRPAVHGRTQPPAAGLSGNEGESGAARGDRWAGNGDHWRSPAADAVLGRVRNRRPDRPCGGDRRGDADRVRAVQAVRNVIAARDGLERRLYFPDHVRQRRSGSGIGSSVSWDTGGGLRCCDDGGCACRCPEVSAVCGALYTGVGAKRDCGRGCGCRSSQRFADCGIGNASSPA